MKKGLNTYTIIAILSLLVILILSIKFGLIDAIKGLFDEKKSEKEAEKREEAEADSLGTPERYYVDRYYEAIYGSFIGNSDEREVLNITREIGNQKRFNKVAELFMRIYGVSLKMSIDTCLDAKEMVEFQNYLR